MCANFSVLRSLETECSSRLGLAGALPRARVESLSRCRALVATVPEGVAPVRVPVSRAERGREFLITGLPIRKLKGLPGVGICSLCGESHSLGEYFQGGPKNPRTGETPYDNFVCELCQSEVVAARVLSNACDLRARRRKAA